MTAEIQKGPLLGQRHVQAVLLFLAIIVNYYGKLNTSVALVAMTNAATTNPNFPEFNWTEMQKSLIIASFFCGYFLTQFPGGYLCHRYGSKAMILISTLGSAVLAMIIPIGVQYGDWQAYCCIRVAQGLFQGIYFPCVYAHLSVWSPVNERNRLGAFASMGIDCGTILAMFVSGMVAASPMGWPGISYLSTAMGGVWSILWLIFSANTPAESKFILPAERSYIEGSANDLKEQDVQRSANPIPIPWRAIFTSGPFLASLVAASCESWGFYTLQAEIPSYMNSVLGMDMKTNAFFSALPYLAMLCTSYVCLILSDVLLHYNMVTLNVLRKSYNTLAFLLPAIGLIVLGLLGEEQINMAIVLMTLCVGLNAASTIGCTLNTIDLSPNHSGILMGINNTFATFIPIITPLYVGLIVNDETDRSQWQIVFVTSAVFLVVGNIVFLVFGSTNTQPWDDENFLLTKNLNAIESKKDCKDSKEVI